jgi:hypothetical protein
MQAASTTDWVIRPGIGLGDLAFGASQDDVRQFLGEPDDVAEDLLGASASIAWYYWSLGVSAHFDGEDGFRLGTLHVERPDAELFGTKLIDLPEEQVRATLDSHDLGEGEYQIMEFSDHPTLCWLRYESRMLNFWFKQGRLESIQWNHLIGADDQVIWPDQA